MVPVRSVRRTFLSYAARSPPSFRCTSTQHARLQRPCTSNASPSDYTQAAEVEVEPGPAAGPSQLTTTAPPTSSSMQQSMSGNRSVRAFPSTTSKDEKVFQVLLAIMAKLWSSPAQFDAFIASRPEATSMPFLLWLADQEAQATGDEKEQLAALCELLVIERELRDQERMEDLYLSTLDMLSGAPDDAPSVAGRALADGSLTAESTGSSSELAQARAGASGRVEEAGPSEEGLADSHVTGSAGLSDLSQAGLVQGEAQSPASASEEGQPGQGQGRGQGDGERQQDHAPQDGETAAAASALVAQQRREQAVAVLSSSPELYAAMLAEQMTGVPATVDGFNPMYDLLLKAAPPAALTPQGIQKAHADAAELAVEMRQRRKRSVAALIGRAKLTPEQADRLKAGSPASRILDMLLTVGEHEERVAVLPDCFTPPPDQEGAGGPGSEGEGEDGTEELWCTPAQLLSEVEVRLRSVAGAGPGEGTPRPGGGGQRVLPGAAGELVGPQLVDALQQLRGAIMERFLSSMERPVGKQ